jgi:hypothetical protein
MKHISRSAVASFAMAAFASLAVGQAAPRSVPLDEDAALARLERTLKRDSVYTHRISLDCVSYGTEETTNAYFQFVLREKHNAKCGGAPDTSPVVDRYRVYRASGKIEWLDRIEDNWRPYNPAQIR